MEIHLMEGAPDERANKSSPLDPGSFTFHASEMVGDSYHLLRWTTNEELILGAIDLLHSTKSSCIKTTMCIGGSCVRRMRNHVGFPSAAAAVALTQCMTFTFHCPLCGLLGELQFD